MNATVYVSSKYSATLHMLDAQQILDLIVTIIMMMIRKTTVVICCLVT